MRADDLGALVRIYNDVVAAIPCNWHHPAQTAENAPSDFIEDDILQFNQSFDSIAGL